MAKYTACICEGAAERAIIDLLLDKKELIFEREDLIEEEVLKSRSAKEFETRYLRKGFSEKITVYRILDSRGEEFKLSKAYEHKVDVVNVITAPEIEMLIIFTEKKYKAYKNEKRKNPQLKPSDFCKINLKYTKVKQYDFVKEYFADIPVLLNALHEYKSKSRIQKNEKTLWDLLREDAGSVKNFVALVKNGSFLVRITGMTILIEKEFIYGSSKRPNPTDYYRKQHYQCG